MPEKNTEGENRTEDIKRTEDQKNIGILEITSLTGEGQGVGRLDGLAVFVDGAIPGDCVKARIFHRTKSYANGQIVERIRPSRDRILPACGIASQCGGCSLQHMDYTAQCAWKQTHVTEAMNRIGGFDRALLDSITSPVLMMEDPFYYRNNVQLPISGNSDDPVIGFYEKNTHTVVDARNCLVQHPVGNRIMETVREWIRQNRISIYDEARGTGLLRHLVVRTGFRTNQVMVVFVMSRNELPFREEILEKLKETVQEIEMTLTSVFLNINDKNTNLVFGKTFVPVFGSETIEEILCGIRYRISSSAFFQVNPVQAEALYNKVVEFAELDPRDTMFDLYCGTGSISLVLAGRCKKVIGVELSDQAIADANENAKANHIHNAEFHAGRAEQVFPEFVSKGVRADAIVVDPPRKGLDSELLESIVRMAPPKIVYVSCNPATLARDCKILCENGGYALKRLQPVDMFPWTGHVETVVLMSRAEAVKA